MRTLLHLGLVCTFLATIAGCNCAEQTRRLSGNDGALPDSNNQQTRDSTFFSDGFASDSQTNSDASTFDPFDPNNRCGLTTVPTTRVPGTVLIVFDYSGSMAAIVAGTSSTRWQLATQAVRDALTNLPDDLNVGLLLFPERQCNVSSAATVAIGPLSSTRSQILAALNPSARPPETNLTPMVQALDRADEILQGVTSAGGKGILAVTDGLQYCSQSDDILSILSGSLQRAEQRRGRGIQTFVVGLEIQFGYLSQLAAAGGTGRANCNPSCQRFIPAPCRPGFGAIDCASLFCHSSGQCRCFGDSECGPGLRCSGDGLCEPANGNSNCCNYAVGATNFQTEFQRAIEEVSSGFRGECTFAVPRDPTMPFDPALVNVGVTFAGEARIVLPQTSDTSVSGWRYTNTNYETLEVSGPICERLRTSQANVEVVLGCQTLIP